MSSQLLLTAAGARPLDGAEVEGPVSVHFDSTVKSQVIRVGETRAAVSATSLGLNCSSRLRFVVLQIAPAGADGSSFELHMRDGTGRVVRYQFSSACPRTRHSRGPVPRVSLPLTGLPGGWCHLVVDVDRLPAHHLAESTAMDPSRPRLEKVVIAPFCQLRRVFTLEELPAGNEGWPRSCAWPSGPAAPLVLLPRGGDVGGVAADAVDEEETERADSPKKAGGMAAAVTTSPSRLRQRVSSSGTITTSKVSRSPPRDSSRARTAPTAENTLVRSPLAKAGAAVTAAEVTSPLESPSRLVVQSPSSPTEMQNVSRAHTAPAADGASQRLRSPRTSPRTSSASPRSTPPHGGLYVYSAAPRTPPVRSNPDTPDVSNDFGPPTPTRDREFASQYSVALTGTARRDTAMTAHVDDENEHDDLALSHSVEELALSQATSHTLEPSESPASTRVDSTDPPTSIAQRPSVLSLPGELDIEGFTVASPSFLAREGWMRRSASSSEDVDGSNAFFGDSSAVRDDEHDRDESDPSTSVGSVYNELLSSSSTNPLKLLRRQVQTDDGGAVLGHAVDGASPDATDMSSGTAQSVFANSDDDDGTRFNSDETDDDNDEYDGRLSPPVVAPLGDAVGDAATSAAAASWGAYYNSSDKSDADGTLIGGDDAHPSVSGSPLSEELSLVYDAELNCWFDPVTHQYYELNV